MVTGEHKGDYNKKRVADPPAFKRTSSKQLHKDAWTGVFQDPSTYLTTQQLARELEEWAHNKGNRKRYLFPESMYRWCKQWFGPLPEGRTGPNMGYRIPLHYRYIARVWWLTEDHATRKAAMEALLEDGTSPKPWVVVVANLGSTHYTVPEAVNRVESLSSMARYKNRVIHILYVGDERTEQP